MPPPLTLFLSRRESGLKNRDGGLGRIHRSIPTEEDESGHPFRYDVDFVLGGRINNVSRRELDYTTADAEGMTERRKRNPSNVVKEAQEAKHVKPAPKKKKPKAATTTKSKTVKKGKTTAGAKHKGKNGKATGKKASTKGKKAEPKKKDETVVVKDLYEPHRREFEKCMARLEKQDTYAFFLGDPPPENDEDYGDSDKDQQASTAQPQAASAAVMPVLATPTKPTTPVFPQTPPFNFAVIRKRMKHDRYVLDRVRQHKERTFSRTAPKLIHPKGVHWDQFRDDMLQMCDAAIARDPDGANGGRGTLGHAAEKTKNVS